MVTTTRHNRDNDKMADRAQKAKGVNQIRKNLYRLKITQI